MFILFNSLPLENGHVLKPYCAYHWVHMASMDECEDIVSEATVSVGGQWEDNPHLNLDSSDGTGWELQGCHFASLDFCPYKARNLY